MVEGVGLGQPRVDMESARFTRMESERSRPATGQPPESRNGTDEVAISYQAALMQRASEAVETASEVRTEKVEQIRMQIASGKYSVSSTDIARRVLDVLG